MDYSAKIKELKKTLKLTTDQIACELGMSSRTFGSYERSESKVPLDLLTNLCNKFNVNPSWFANDIGEMFINNSNTLKKLESSRTLQNYDTFYKRFNELLKVNELSDFQFSKLTGITESRIEKLGIGKVQPTLDELNTIKKHFNVSIDWLLYGEGEVQKSAQVKAETQSLSADEIEILKKLAKKFNI